MNSSGITDSLLLEMKKMAYNVSGLPVPDTLSVGSDTSQIVTTGDLNRKRSWFKLPPIPSKINELNIKNFYAFSKYAGELAAMSLKNVSILRTNFFGLSLTSARSSFTDWVYESAKNKNDITCSSQNN